MGETGRPTKEDSPLIVDPDAVESTQIASKCLEAIAGRGSQVIEVVSGIEDVELVQDDPEQILGESTNAGC